MAKISANDERRLTNAIEKAATLAVADTSKDRDRLLAACLLDSDVDSRLAKMASAAFNRRVTVLTFQQTDDSHKADSFPLTDADKVHELMGGKPSQNKTASVASAPFSISLEAETAPIEKTASCEPVAPAKRNYEDRVSWDTFTMHVLSDMEKMASEHVQLLGLLNTLDCQIKKQRAELGEELSKCASFTLSTLGNTFGERLNYALGDKAPVKFEKKASVVRQHDKLTEKVAALVDLVEARDTINNMAADYQQHSLNIAFTADDIGEAVMRKKAALPLHTVANSITLPVMTGLNAAETVRRATADAASQGFAAASALNNAGTDVSMSPSKILDAEFLVKDRFRDRLLAWSDMTADKAFAGYPAYQLFAATQKALDFDPSLERPDKRELLRTYVGTLLAQNGRADMANVNQMSAILKAIGAAPKGIVSAADEARALDKTDRPQLDKSLAELVLGKGAERDKLTDWHKAITDAEAAQDKDDKERAKEEREHMSDEAKQRAEKNKQIADFMKNTKITANYNANGQIDYTLNGQRLTPADLKNMYEAYSNNLAAITVA